MKKYLTALTVTLLLCSCIAGAPRLTKTQKAKMASMEVVKKGDAFSKQYKTLQEVSAANCSGIGWGISGVWGNSGKAIDTLKAKAIVLNADAVIETSCSSMTLINNCWLGVKCDGIAVKIIP